MNDLEQIFKDFLLESESILEIHEKPPIEDIIRSYNSLKICATQACESILLIDTSYRVQLCKQMDKLLNLIVDCNDTTITTNSNIFTPAVHNYRTWNNVEMMKDKCLTGFMLGKEIQAKSHMFFCKPTINYTLAQDLPGLELIETESTNELAYYDFLEQNYQKMDILILHGMYPETIPYLEHYRQFRPDGKVYCGLDMNRYWMSRITWDDTKIQNFFRHCDLVATSCTSLRDKLNANPNVNFACRYMPNGFYNPTNIPIRASLSHKKNTILTVGRIGSEQKNNVELVLGFAKIAHLIPQWNLKLVGDIEESFIEFLENVYSTVPQLKNRIILTGSINSKLDLYNEYAQAKIFALTSTLEGGTPNVYAEALFHGCKFITSDIDGADDITDYGKLGLVYKLGDLDDLSKKILKLCKQTHEKKEQKHIKSALMYAEREFSWERNAKKLAFSLLEN